MILHIQQLTQLKDSFNLNIKAKKKETTIKLYLFLTKKTRPSYKNEIIINNKMLDDYFNINEVRQIIQTLITSSIYKEYYFTILGYVKGGGLINQSKTIVLGLKYLLKKNANILQTNFFINNSKQYLRTDYRRKERKKYGLKKARKASQYHKR